MIAEELPLELEMLTPAFVILTVNPVPAVSATPVPATAPEPMGAQFIGSTIVHGDAAETTPQNKSMKNATVTAIRLTFKDENDWRGFIWCSSE